VFDGVDVSVGVLLDVRVGDGVVVIVAVRVFEGVGVSVTYVG